MLDIYLYDNLQMEDTVKGLQAELYDSAYPLIRKVVVTSNKDVVFRDADYVFLAGSKSREPSFKDRRELVIEGSKMF